ncbi:MAG: hypothetical protein C0413_00735 [Clostridiales bacterium]|nr:hypothetical protein [Clostridiales bacterium]
MRTVEIRKNGEIIAEVWHAKGYFARLRGLLGRTLQEGGGMLLTPCNAIHTFGMRYAIDALYLDKEGCVLRVDEAIQPGKVMPLQRGARHVLELQKGCANRRSVSVGDVLEVIR